MKALMMMVFGMVMLRTCNTPSANYAPPTPVSFQQFYDELSPYGNWIETPNDGYAWVPDVEEGFRPYYTNGNWVATDQGNTWVSGYPWGWAPFHYGNWGYTDPYGWAWKPGYDWAPAHVSWRQGNGFYGWAPLLANLALGKLLNDDDRPDDWWVFVPQARLYDNNVYRYWRGPQYNAGILPYTTYLTNVYKGKAGNSYYFGPRPNEWVKQTGKKLNVRRVLDVSNQSYAGNKRNGLHVYRPQVKQDKGARPSPNKVMQGWSGKGHGNKPANVKTDDRGNRQPHKAPPAVKQNGRAPGDRGKQQVHPERKQSSPAKQTKHTAPVQKQHKATAPKQQRSSSRPAKQNVRQSRPPAPKKQAQPARQKQQHAQPHQQRTAQPAGQHGGGRGGQHGGSRGGGKHGGGGGKNK